MGEYAEAFMWAEMNGYDGGDMPPEAWARFYEEYDARPVMASKRRCPICGKKTGERAVRKHIEHVHKNEKGGAALAALDQQS